MHTFSEERQKLKVLIDNSPDFMGISNNDNVIEYLNRAAYKLLGIDEDVDLKTLRSSQFYAPHEAEHMREIYNMLMEKGSWKGRVILKHFKTGELIPGYGSYETVTDPITGKQIAKSTTVRDLRPELNAQKALRESEATFRHVTQNAPTGLWMSDKEGGLIYLNKTLVEWTGMPYQQLLGTGWANAIVEEDRQRGAEVFFAAVASRSHYDVEFRIKKKDGSIVWCRAAGDPYFDDDGAYAGYAGFCMDIHQRVEMANTIRESEQQIKSIVDQAPVAISVLKGKDLIIDSANKSILKIWGKDLSVIGLPVEEALPEIKGQGFVELLQGVYDTGIAHYRNAASVQLEHEGKREDLFIDFVYAPIKDASDLTTGILVIATDVTPLFLAKKQAEESELFSRTILYNSPVAKFVLLGEEMKISSSNEKMLELIGRDDSIVGKTFKEILPELADSPLMENMLNVYRTGETFQQPEERLELMKAGKPYTGYYSYIYKALRATSGDIYGIMVTANEITDQVLARQKVEEAQLSLQGAIDLANLGTFSIDLKEKTLQYDNRMRSWFGFSEDEVITPEKSGLPCDKDELPRLQQALLEAIAPGGSGNYDVEYTITNLKSGIKRILHTQGKTFRDAHGNAYKISGSSRDITKEREIQLELTRQVQERTEELAATNEELAASNEELQATNEELEATSEEMEEANASLNRSNEELSQYAYVASHDLQEPLRKIRVYTGMLEKHKSLSEESKGLVNKISKSSERMSLLIKDLLEFSRLMKADILFNLVDLNETLKDIISDFELIISEKKAVVQIEQLPVVDAVALQMNQLFYNLLSNALKFSDPNIPPVIHIRSHLLSSEELRNYIHKPVVSSTYYTISISDNGIGFDEQYSEQIFEVFKRLHGKDIYPGSGIGLALCRRIVANHGGQLYVRSKPGEGTTFNIILHGLSE